MKNKADIHVHTKQLLCFREAYKLRPASYGHKLAPQYAKEVQHISGQTLTCMWLLYGICEYCTYQITALLLGMRLFWFGWRMSYGWRATTSKLSQTVSEDILHSHSSNFGASLHVFWAWHV